MPKKSRIACVTGASSGFGAAIAEKLIKEGFKVIAAARRMDKLKDLQAKLGKNLLPLELDVSSPTSIKKAFSSLPKEFSDIEILINNAGLALGLDPVHQAKLDDWEKMIDVNIKGLLYMTHALLPQMVKRDAGHIVNLGSIAGEFPYPGGNVYGATKAFVRQFTLNMKSDLVGTKVRVTNIEPGLAGGTEFSLTRYKGDAEKAKKVYEGTKPLSAEDIAEAVFWVISQPEHVNVNTLSVMPVCQGFGPFKIQHG